MRALKRQIEATETKPQTDRMQKRIRECGGKLKITERDPAHQQSQTAKTLKHINHRCRLAPYWREPAHARTTAGRAVLMRRE